MTLALFVDPADRRRTSASLYDQLREAIAADRLAPGARLPTSRELAAELAVARSTVTTVYARLRAEGFLDARTGDGTFVARHRHERRSPAAALAPTPASGRGPSVRSRGGAVRIDLRTGRPDPTLFPLLDWRRCVVDALQAPPPGYGDAAGLPVLRAALAAWVARSRGVVADADEIVVTAGAQQAFDLCAAAMVARHDTVAVEEPGYGPAHEVFAHRGARVVPVPVDEQGIVVEQVPRRSRLIYVTPSHQAPTGVTMSAERRRALLALARSTGAIIVEDDYDTEFRYVDRPLEPMQRLDRHGSVAYVGSFSKTLSPSLRLGFVVAPPTLAVRLREVRRLADLQPPHLTQAALAALLTSGRFDRHLRRTRKVYRARHDLVAARLAALHDEGLVARPHAANAGLHHMVDLPDGVDPEAIVARLRGRGTAVEAVVTRGVSPARRGLTIGFGLAGLADLDAGLSQLRAELRAARR